MLFAHGILHIMLLWGASNEFRTLFLHELLSSLFLLTSRHPTIPLIPCYLVAYKFGIVYVHCNLNRVIQSYTHFTVDGPNLHTTCLNYRDVPKLNLWFARIVLFGNIYSPRLKSKVQSKVRDCRDGYSLFVAIKSSRHGFLKTYFRNHRAIHAQHRVKL